MFRLFVLYKILIWVLKKKSNDLIIYVIEGFSINKNGWKKSWIRSESYVRILDPVEFEFSESNVEVGLGLFRFNHHNIKGTSRQKKYFEMYL